MGQGRARTAREGKHQLCSDFHVRNVVVELVLSQNTICYHSGRIRFKVPLAWTLQNLHQGLCVIVPRGRARGYNILVFLMFFLNSGNPKVIICCNDAIIKLW